MLSDWAGEIATGGSAQYSREPYALKHGYFLPQERALHEHIAAAARLSRSTVMPSPSGGMGGDWSRLFDDEPAVALARLLSIRTDQRRLAFETSLRFGGGPALEGLRVVARELSVIQMTLRRHDYESLCARMNAAAGDADFLERLLERLDDPKTSTAGELAKVLARERGAPLAGDAFERGRAARLTLEHAHEQLLNVCDAVKAPASSALEERLASGLIEPALGLIIAQLDLLDPIQERINGFVGRHTDLYYRDVLGQAPRAKTAETILLRFRPAGTVAHVKAGARILGDGPGVAEPLRYELIEPVMATPHVVGACPEPGV